MNAIDVDVPPPQESARRTAVPWGWRDMGLAIGMAALGIVVLNLIALAAGLWLHVTMRENGVLLVVFVVVQDAVVVGAAWLFSVVRYHVDWARLGLRSYAVASGCALSAGLLLVSYVARMVYGLVAYRLGWQIEQQQMLNQLDLRGAGFFFSFLGVAVIVPVAEEIFFRGFLYGGLRERIGVIGAMAVSASFFTALHLSIDLFVPIFVLGLFLAWLYEITGSLYPSIFLHAANNGIALIVLWVLQETNLLPNLPVQ